ncbi:hypothetical protein G9A89_009613 [Geosiphon pyriformis]|nr:hypothetical protein G9A89_009613 [Geosiphon pyriformis]
MSVDIGLGGFLNSQLNLVHRQIMKKKWKYKVSGISSKIWKKFGDASLTAASKSAGDFEYHTTKSDINGMWKLLCQMVHSATEAALIKTRSSNCGLALVNKWIDLNFDQTVEFKSSLGNSHDRVLATKDSQIWAAIDKCMEAFINNKDQMIRSVLEKPFRKVTLDHLVDNGDLVLEPDLVKGRVD